MDVREPCSGRTGSSSANAATSTAAMVTRRSTNRLRGRRWGRGDVCRSSGTVPCAVDVSEAALVSGDDVLSASSLRTGVGGSKTYPVLETVRNQCRCSSPKALRSIHTPCVRFASSTITPCQTRSNSESREWTCRVRPGTPAAGRTRAAAVPVARRRDVRPGGWADRCAGHRPPVDACARARARSFSRSRSLMLSDLGVETLAANPCATPTATAGASAWNDIDVPLCGRPNDIGGRVADCCRRSASVSGVIRI